jgi:hypothetical protein
MLRLPAFVLPLGVDSFAVAAALGAAGLTGIRERLRVSLIFAAPAGCGQQPDRRGQPCARPLTRGYK